MTQFLLLVVIAIPFLLLACLVRAGGPGRQGQWVWHPESPGLRIWVERGFWGRVFKPTEFATLAEASEYLSQRGLGS